MRIPGIGGGGGISEAIAGAIANRQRKREGRGDSRAGRVAGGVAIGNLGLNAVQAGTGLYSAVSDIAQKIADREAAREKAAREAALGEDTLSLAREKFAWEKEHPDPTKEAAALNNAMTAFKYRQMQGLEAPEDEIAREAARRRAEEARGIPTPPGAGPPSALSDYNRILERLSASEEPAEGYRYDPESLGKMELLPYARMLERITTQEGESAIPAPFRDQVMSEILRRRLLGQGTTTPPTGDEILKAIPDIPSPAPVTGDPGFMGIGTMGREIQDTQRQEENRRREAMRQLLWESIAGKGAILGAPGP